MYLIKDSYVLFLTSALSALIAFLSGIWLRNILGPEEYGMWLVFSLVLTYGYVMHLGILDSFNRDIPLLTGQKKHEQVAHIRNVVFSWMALSGVLSIVAVVIVLFMHMPLATKIFAVIALLLIPIQNMTLYHNAIFLTMQEFKGVAMIQFIIGCVQYILMTVFSVYLGLLGLFIGVVLGNILAITYARFRLKFRLTFTLDKKLLIKMMSIGFPITMVTIFLSVFTTLDRLIILYFFDSTAVGFYGITAFVYQGIMVLPKVLHQVAYPKISFTYGKVKSKKALKKLILNPTVYLSYYSPFTLGVIYLGLPSFINNYMPQYDEGTRSAQIVTMGLFFLLWAALFSHYLNVVNKQWLQLKLLIIVVIVNILLNIGFVLQGLYIEGIALATSISYMIYPLLLMWLCFRDMSLSTKIFLKQAGIIILPFLFMAVTLFFLSHIEEHVLLLISCYVLLYSFFLFVASRFLPFLFNLPNATFQSIMAKLNGK
ncbi:oligosaccharide flippase family protein [Fictibacillus sp. UD]|uniref:oligosaccharide flippase family protein n=1 Tax=Fictibacillus sp. UD TaxID=3038777 RepID=UPI003745A82A